MDMKQFAVTECPVCGSTVQTAPGRNKHCPYCGGVLHDADSDGGFAFAADMQDAAEMPDFSPPPVQQMPAPRMIISEPVFPSGTAYDDSEERDEKYGLSPAKWCIGAVLSLVLSVCAFVNSEIFKNVDWILYPSVLLLMFSFLFLPVLLAATAPKKILGSNPAVRLIFGIALYPFMLFLIRSGGWAVIHLISQFL